MPSNRSTEPNLPIILWEQMTIKKESSKSTLKKQNNWKLCLKPLLHITAFSNPLELAELEKMRISNSGLKNQTYKI